MSEPAPYDGDTRTPGSAALVAFLFIFVAAGIALAALIFTLVTDPHPAATVPAEQQQSRGENAPAWLVVNPPQPHPSLTPTPRDRHDRPATRFMRPAPAPVLQPNDARLVYIRIPGARLLRSPQFGEWQLTRFV